jgi:NADH:ubiquinone oxidoreductase subunit E
MGKKEKVMVRICVGTACFVQGGADLLLYNDFLDPVVLANCDIEGVSCLNMCKQVAAGSPQNVKPPFIMINDKVYGDITQERFCKLLAEAVNA